MTEMWRFLARLELLRDDKNRQVTSLPRMDDFFGTDSKIEYHRLCITILNGVSAMTEKKSGKPEKVANKATARKTAAKKDADKPVLLSGGNPQIAKGYGDAPVQAYIAAMPGWKQGAGRRLDEIVERTVPGVYKAVKWNSPFYCFEGEGWFLSFHCFTKYIKVTFFRGTSLRPVPPGESKHPEVRYLDIYEDGLDEAEFADWVKQASRLPGERM